MEKVKIYLDEDVRPLLAEVLRSKGYDAVSCVERGFFGLSDKEQLNIAIKERRAILTHNIKDFVQLHNSATTKAGRLLAWVKSENGKGTTTTSPFTNLAKPRPPQVLANLS